MKVKICANKSIKDAKMCLDAKADIIGVLVGTKQSNADFIDKERAKKICDFVGGRAEMSLVTHLTSADEIIDLTKYIGNNVIQLHSNIQEREVEKIRKALPDVKLVRLIHVAKDGTIVTDIERIRDADFYLMDSFNLTTGQVGGTGITYDWKKVRKVIKKLKHPVFIAGGLNPENVRQAIKEAKPYGVDINTGSKVNGKKNAEKVREFVFNAKN